MRLRLLGLLGLLALTALGGSRVRFTADTTDILPTDSALRATLAAAQGFAGAQTLIVEVDGSGTDRERLKTTVEALAVSLRALPVVAEVRAGFGFDDGARIHQKVAPYAAAFVDPDVLAARTSEAGVRATLEQQRSRLVGFAGAFLADQVRRDPLDLTALATQALARGAHPGAHLEDGLLLDATGTHALILVTAAVPTSSVVPDDERVRALRDVLAASPLPTRWMGGLRMADETASSIADDVAWVSALGTALLAGVLLVGFRSWRPVVGAIPPLLVASGCVAVGAWWASPIHGLQLGFGAALAGLAVDYWIHLYLAVAGRPDQPDAASRYRAAVQALHELLPALALSAGSTAIAFAMLCTSTLPIVRVLGFTGAAAAIGALLGTALAGPLVWAAIGRPEPVTHDQVPERAATPTLIAVVVLGLFAVGSRFDADPMALVQVSADAEADRRRLSDRWGAGAQQGLILLEGEDIGQTLDRADAVERAIDAIGVVDATGPASLVPGPAQVAARRAVLPDAPTLQARLDTSADELGLPRFEGAAERLLATAVRPPTDLWDGTPLSARVQLRDRTALVTAPLRDPDVAWAVRDALAGAAPGAVLVVPGGAAAEGLSDARDALAGRAALAGGAVYLLLLLRHRHPGRAALAMLPAGAALVGALGAMGLVGRAWNPVSVAAMVPVLGLAVDYGVFMTEGSRTAPRAVVLSAATTLAGFAPLVIAVSPALVGVGVATAAGVACAAAVALLALPAMQDAPDWPGPRVRVAATAAAFVGVMGLQGQLLALVTAAPPRATDALPDAFPLEVHGAQRRYGPHELLHDHGVWVLRTEGDPYRAGFAAGALTRHLHDRLRPASAAGWRIPGREGKVTLDRRLELQGHADAIADGGWFEGSATTRLLAAQSLPPTGQGPGFAAGGPATADGRWLLARTVEVDDPTSYDRDKILRVHRPARGLAHLSVGWVGLVGVVSGVNEAGLAVTAHPSDAAGLAANLTLALRGILEDARNLDDVEQILRARPDLGPAQVLAVDGDGGAAAVFELEPGRVRRIDADRWIAVADPRRPRVEELVTRSLGALDADLAIGVLTDTRGLGDRPLPRGHRLALSADRAAHGVVIDASTRTVRVSRYPNLSGGFVELRLADALRGELAVRQVTSPDVDPGRALDTHAAYDLLRRAQHASPAEALELTADALQLLPEHPEALVARARALIAVGRRSDAEPLLLAAQQAPEDAGQARAIEELLR